MSITDELRELKGNIQTYLSPEAVLALRSELNCIADRIDREHRMAMEKVAAEADAMPMTDESMAEHGWIRLPVDADGVPVHVGDDLDGLHYEGGTVTGIQYGLAANGTIIELVAVRPHGWDTATWRDPEEYRHHHVPTVEDVLREFAEKMNENLGMYTGEAIDADEWRKADERTIAEYAAKLRLAGDGE